MAGLTGAWEQAMKPEFAKPYYRKLFMSVQEEYRNHTVYPPAKDIFNAFHFTPLEQVRVVILGQDPYHEPGQAEGLSFSVRPGVEIPPSLQNIYKEKQGVRLLNSVLTGRAHAANSHASIGWEEFTDAAVRVLADQDRPMVFILWGRSAQKKAAVIYNRKHLILRSPHPSPLSAYHGFFGSRPFSKTNAYLEQNGLRPIDWQIENI